MSVPEEAIRALNAYAPIEIMKFVLRYDGDLKSSGNGASRARQKWEIRVAVHRQLEHLWQTNPVLVRLSKETVPKGGFWTIERHHHHDHPIDPQRGRDPDDELHLYEPIERHGKLFIPLVRNTMALICDLDILFLRSAGPGGTFEGGDIDNRIKTLLDALKTPTHMEEVRSCPDQELLPQPLYTLMEDDALLSDLSVRPDRLLQANASKSAVSLVITVTLKATLVRSYNLPLIGG